MSSLLYTGNNNVSIGLMNVQKSIVIIVFMHCLLISCKLNQKEEWNLDVKEPYRCGIYKSYYFVREVQQKVYPDLGLLIANAPKLRLTDSQLLALRENARQCAELCEIEKDQLRLMQEKIKEKLALNEVKGDLRKLAHDVSGYNTAFEHWLKGHTARYRTGKMGLAADAQPLIAQIESHLTPLPEK